ncbi:hypothetical protein [Natronomonas amylolytica]|uniref:hypothetical protein n=1 Tax=Natronomonas amylolytica TaxID=3108498 RepID=UPI00300BA2DD
MSLVGTYLGGFRDRLASAVERSRVIGAFEGIESTLQQWASGSRIVRWFLAEPEPEVIVIDLRETYTVGPVIRALDWAVARGDRLAERTGLTSALRRTTQRIEAEPLSVVGWILFAFALGGLATSFVSGSLSAGWLLLAGFGLLAIRERRSASELAETRVGRGLIAAFEPPEPPERDDES